MATELQGAKGLVSPKKIWAVLSDRKTWYLTPSAPYRNRFAVGDRIVFYLGGPIGGRAFVGHGLCGDAIQSLNESDEEFLEELGLPFFGWRLPLSEVTPWGQSVPIKELIPELTFIKDKKNYGLHLRLGIVSISTDDYQHILDAAHRISDL